MTRTMKGVTIRLENESLHGQTLLYLVWFTSIEFSYEAYICENSDQ